MVLVDSSIWMEAARRHGRLECKIGLESLIQEGEALICGPIRMEVLAGARPDDRERMAAGFASLPYEPMSDEDWVSATECAAKLVDCGMSAPFRAVVVASQALNWDCRIYTLDPVFTSLQKPLGIRLYHPGYGGKFEPDTLPRQKITQDRPKPVEKPIMPVVPEKKKISPSAMDVGLWD